jgi:hypothetical protein
VAEPIVKPAEVFEVKKLFMQQKIVDVPLNIVARKGNLVSFSFLLLPFSSFQYLCSLTYTSPTLALTHSLSLLHSLLLLHSLSHSLLLLHSLSLKKTYKKTYKKNLSFSLENQKIKTYIHLNDQVSIREENCSPHPLYSTLSPEYVVHGLV